MSKEDLVCPKCGLQCKSGGGYGKHVPTCKGKRKVAAEPQTDRDPDEERQRERAVQRRTADLEREEKILGGRLPAWGGYGTLDRLTEAIAWRHAADVLADSGKKMPDFLNGGDREAAEALL